MPFGLVSLIFVKEKVLVVNCINCLNFSLVANWEWYSRASVSHWYCYAFRFSCIDFFFLLESVVAVGG